MNKTQNINIATNRKIIGNTFFSTLSELSLFMTSIFFILAARFLGDAEFGKFSAAVGFVSLFSILVLFGFNYSITKIVVSRRDNAGTYIGHALYIQLGFAFISFFLCLACAWLLRSRYPAEIRLLMAAVFGAETLRCFGFTLRASVKAVGKFHLDTLAINMERLMLLIAGIPVLLITRNIFWVAGLLAFSRLIGVCILIFSLYRSRIKCLVRFDPNVAVELVKKSAIYVVQSSFWRIYDHIDVVMLSLMRSFAEVGWYKAGRQILEGLWFIPNILTEVTYPEMSARNLVSREQVFTLFDRVLKYMLIMGIMVTIGTVIIAKPLVNLIYGEGYEKTSVILVLLGMTVIPSYLRYMFGNTIIAINLQKKEMNISIGRSSFNALANLVLIPFWGVIGATVATVATDYFAIYFYVRVLQQERLIRKDQIKYIHKPIAAAAVCAVFYVMMLPLHGFIQFAVIVPVYIMLLLLLKVFDQDEQRLFLNTFRSWIYDRRLRKNIKG